MQSVCTIGPPVLSEAKQAVLWCPSFLPSISGGAVAVAGGGGGEQKEEAKEEAKEEKKEESEEESDDDMGFGLFD